jgi:hypothetical protein
MTTPTNITKKTGRGWAYTGALLGGAVSIAANVAHSYVPPTGAPADWHPHTGAVVGAVFWPLALFVAVEIFARIAWPTGQRWTALRFLGLLPVALVAAVVSYRHLSGLLAFYREDTLTATIGPLAVDGLMVMATGALIATGARRAAVVDLRDTAPAAERVPALSPVVDPAPDATQDTTSDARTETAPARKRTPRHTGKADTATAVARLRARHPDMPTVDIARRLGVTDRTVRRHLSARTVQTAPTPLAA